MAHTEESTMDLATATPVEVDTALAEIYTRLYAAYDQADRLRSWIKEHSEGLEKSRAGNMQYSGYTEQALQDLRDRLRDVSEQAIAIQAETKPYEAEYRSRPWSRFFLVQNSGGHIHSSMACSTCFPTTRFGWLPNLSGQTEPEAVAAHGAILCTVCYPSAPVEWTDRRDDSVCTGSGQYYDSSRPHRGPQFYSGNWAECPVCGTNQTMSKTGKIRKHKKQESN